MPFHFCAITTILHIHEQRSASSASVTSLVKVQRQSFSSHISSNCKRRRVYPPGLRSWHALLVDVFLVVSLGSPKSSRSELPLFLRRGCTCASNFGHRLCDDPVTVLASGNQLFRNLNVLTVSGVAGSHDVFRRQDLNINDRENSVVYVVVVNFSSNAFFTNVVDTWNNSVMNNSYYEIIWSAETRMHRAGFL